MFGTLGEIVFTTISGPDSFESVQRWQYAEHPVIEDAPRIQWTGNGLQRLVIGMMFHQSFTDPVAQLNALMAAASDHQARALVFANGTHQGYFVIAGLRTVQKLMSDAGDPVCIKVSVELTEWVLAKELDPAAAPVPSFVPIGAVPAPAGGVTGPLAAAAAAGGGPVASSYAAPLLAAAGVSSLLTNPAPTAPASAALTAADIAPSLIVRSPV
ncbi:MAG TPA: phage tail protein [Candidatus Binataceae bacterium]|jgi:phage protein U|nr:phage tail protein [Candidatus Binataceae bacterium]